MSRIAILTILTATAAVRSAPATGSGPASPGSAGVPCTPWPATDDPGRALPLSDLTGPPRPDRFVGIFYFLWLNERANRSPHFDGPPDVSRILARDPHALSKPDSPLWGPIGAFHYWGEPLYGYYLSSDPWVLRRHAHLLADAGIDTLIFDTTNGPTYREVYMALCEVFAAVRAEGDRTPQIAFMVNSAAGRTARQIYEDLYRPNLYPELWFRWQGRPLMICDPAQADEELRGFFTLRRAHWPHTIENTAYAWHWEAAYPQVYGYTDDPGRPEQVNVSVAQNLDIATGLPVNMSEGRARGRSFHQGRTDRTPGAVRRGLNFQEQFERALQLDPPFVMITGWNEWIAGRWGQPGGPIIFVDQFDQEHSRDIEPMKGGHGDDYYWQMVAGVRRYKGTPPLPAASPPASIDLDGPMSQWESVRPEYRDHLGETAPRDFDGAGGLHYTHRTGRNDIVSCRVARDDRRLYFQLRTREPIVRHDSGWMWLLIDADRDVRTGWHGFDFVVNRTGGDRRAGRLEKYAQGRWEPVADVALRVEGRDLHLAAEREQLGLTAGQTSAAIDFKWWDAPGPAPDIMDVYLNGDAAPEGRFTFRYQAP